MNQNDSKLWSVILLLLSMSLSGLYRHFGLAGIFTWQMHYNLDGTYKFTIAHLLASLVSSLGWMVRVISKFDLSIAHVPGKANIMADALYRHYDHVPGI